MSSISNIKVEQSFELLIKCMMQSKHRLIELGAELDLTSMQAMMLLLLNKPKAMNGFTKVFNCDASNVTGIVDGLENKELAARFPDTSDRRIKMIKLSKHGEAVRAELLKRLVDKHGSALYKLSAQELDEFIGLLQKITDPSV